LAEDAARTALARMDPADAEKVNAEIRALRQSTT
jgi:hypothetical protein